MKIVDTNIYRGPNYYSLHHTVIRATVDLGELEQYPSDTLRDFNEHLVAALPTLETHHCSVGRPGGFIVRLRRGTWMGHILEHVAIELQNLAGGEVGFGKTRGVGRPGVYHVVFEYQEEKVGLAALDLAQKLLRSLLPPELPSALPPEERQALDPPRELEELAALHAEVALGPSTRALVEAARQRGIPSMRLNELSLVQLGYGSRQKRIQAAATSATSQIAVEIAGDKALTNRLLAEAGLPVPAQVQVYSVEEAEEAARRIGYPVITKPANLNHGRGVRLNAAGTVHLGYQLAVAQGDGPVIVEQYLSGNDYRLLVVNDQVAAAARRIPAHVTGDGMHTIRELVDRENADPRRGLDHEKALTRIRIDQQALDMLAEQNCTPETVLPQGVVCALRRAANLSSGGTAIDATDEVHPHNRLLARRAARVLGLDIAGIDLITPDITRPVSETGGGIIEVNAAPGLRMHLSPSEGQPRDVASPVIDMLYPPGAPSRIPIAAITGTNGKTTTAFMVGHILKIAGFRPGLATTAGIYIDGERVVEGDTTGPWSARLVLRDPGVDAAVLETARGGMLRGGLAYDRCDVGVILNITDDHLGVGGIETLEQMVEVKALVIETVSPAGYAVLNADDPLVATLAPRSPGRPFYFSLDGSNPRLVDHVRQGGRAVALEQLRTGAAVVYYSQGRKTSVLRINRVPAALEGRARFNVANTLAAVAIALSLEIPIAEIRRALYSFAPAFEHTPGRLSIIDDLGFRVILDYAHNPAAMQEMSRLVQGMDGGRKKGVIAAPGDRRDSDIRKLGWIAGRTFDELVIKEDHDLRGRRPGEVAALLQGAARQAGLAPEQIRLIADEVEAVTHALDHALPGELVVIFADQVDAVYQLLDLRRENGGPSKRRRYRVARAEPRGSTAPL